MAYHRLPPHSSAWFERLLEFNPQQAFHTGAMINAAGREDVCSMCGDHPASDYEVVFPTPSENSVATYRLCDDCYQIRVDIEGERFKPYP